MTTKVYGHAHALHNLEPHYSRHVSAMTSEGLDRKSDIAAELAWRDAEIEFYKRENARLYVDIESRNADSVSLRLLLTEAAEAIRSLACGEPSSESVVALERRIDATLGAR